MRKWIKTSQHYHLQYEKSWLFLRFAKECLRVLINEYHFKVFLPFLKSNLYFTYLSFESIHFFYKFNLFFHLFVFLRSYNNCLTPFSTTQETNYFLTAVEFPLKAWAPISIIQPTVPFVADNVTPAASYASDVSPAC